MEHEKWAPIAGVGASLLAVVAVVLPYAVVPEVDQAAVSAQYYGVGAVTPLAIGLLALVGAMAFAAGLRGRSDPSLVAGLTAVIGLVSLFVALQWVLTVPARVGQTADTADVLAAHRWSIPLTAAGIAASAGWYAWALGLFGGRGRPSSRRAR